MQVRALIRAGQWLAAFKPHRGRQAQRCGQRYVRDKGVSCSDANQHLPADNALNMHVSHLPTGLMTTRWQSCSIPAQL